MTVVTLEPRPRRFHVEISAESLDKTAGLDRRRRSQPRKGDARQRPARRPSRLRPCRRRRPGHALRARSASRGSCEVEAPAALARFLAVKGSVAVDGVSLTVNRVDDRASGCAIGINLIPHTVQNTSLRGLAVGRRVNLEIDLIARYVERMLGLCPARRPDNHPNAYNFAMAIAPIPELVAELAAGRMVILVDEEDRENEGDLVLAADHVTPEAINFMAKFGRGLICLTLTRERCERLQLPPMTAQNGTQHGTAFTVSIEAASGVTTGISAADRARTVQAAVREGRARQRPGAARPHLPAAGAGRRRADARRPHRSRLRPGGDGRPDAGRRDLRSHERRRHDGAPARPDRLRASSTA